MIERQLSTLISRAVEAAGPGLGLGPEVPEVELTRPRQREHGDYATNVALGLAARLGRNPREVAEAVAAHLPRSDLLAKVEVAGPGFINLFVAHGWLYRVLGEVERRGTAFGRSDEGGGQRVQVEYVSANPTGPLHVGSARGAVLGDSLARLLEASGYSVEREYYVNDRGTQIELFAASVEARYLQRFGRDTEIPEGGYAGPYLLDLAGEIAADLGDTMLEAPGEERRRRLLEEAVRRNLDAIARTLERLAARIDIWFRQSTLEDEGSVQEAVEELRRLGLAYDHEGAVWFRSTRFGDDRDRVLIRSTGEPTYFAADCAYLRNKFGRGFERLLYVWGADHHGTVQRLRGAAQGLGHDPGTTEFILYQLVHLYRGGQPVRMSKRTGDIITVDEVLDEVGPDATRYTLLSRSVDSALEFDIEEVKRRTLDNPVYYVQYAHARIASVLGFARDEGVELRPLDRVRSEELVHETELALLRKIADFPEQVRVATAMRAPYRLTRYAEELAAGFHRFYTECRVVSEDAELTQARLHLAAATKLVIGNVLDLLGVSAPDSMERLEERG